MVLSTGQLRPGRREDYADFARLFGELGVEEPPPPVALWEADLAQRSFFVDGSQGPRAYALTDVLGETGYVVNLVVARGERRRGLGREVMRALAAYFRHRGCRQWMLNVKPDNVAAVALYRGLGMERGLLDTTLHLTRAQVEALPAAPAGLEVVRVKEEAELARLTETWGLVPGKLARYATLPGHQLWRLTHREASGAEPLGMMDVRAAAGVLFPFFAAAPGHARALLEAGLRELGGVESLRVVVASPELESALRAGGATVGLVTLRMQGPLP
jgi:GNAT superfamily N-acetyltransferase